MEVSPFMIMWDPATYPQFQRIADIGRTDTKVFYFEGDTTALPLSHLFRCHTRWLSLSVLSDPGGA
jgi:hypothetical protein